ncbi:hypothetical protein Hanom_Chr02g00121921 [Helianthus anomalus]
MDRVVEETKALSYLSVKSRSKEVATTRESFLISLVCFRYGAYSSGFFHVCFGGSLTPAC